MYINFWYPIVRSEDLSMDEPQKVKVLGTNLVAFRDESGAAKVLSDTCVHRGGSLSKGWVKGGCAIFLGKEPCRLLSFQCFLIMTQTGAKKIPGCSPPMCSVFLL